MTPLNTSPRTIRPAYRLSGDVVLDRYDRLCVERLAASSQQRPAGVLDGVRRATAIAGSWLDRLTESAYDALLAAIPTRSEVRLLLVETDSRRAARVAAYEGSE